MALIDDDPAALARRIWAKDAAVWGQDSARKKHVSAFLGWLRAAEQMGMRVADITAFAAEAKRAGFKRALLLGMGGSSLAPFVMARVFGAEKGMPVEVVDTTDPAQVRASSRGAADGTLFIVSSKSGGTIEVDSLFRHFWKETGGRGDRFVAITDPGTQLERNGTDRKFRRVFTGFPDVGGRYSALTPFGMVPAALLGVDIGALLARGVRMMYECNLTPPARNPGLELGLALGRAWREGRDKVTLVPDRRLEPFGLWVEQLLAESTGKDGRGLVPVAGEPPGRPENCGADRVFVRVALEGEDDAGADAALVSLEKAGHPVVRIRLKDALDLGAEFFRWEFATAVAGAVLEVNPFDQPNVAEAKERTKAALDELAASGNLPEPPPGDTAEEVRTALESLVPGRDYLALLAFLPYDSGLEKALQDLRISLRDRYRVATTLGFGPRYLHSTGQLHKGGAANGVFLIFTCDHAEDLPVPDAPYTFGQLERAQALGDLASLADRGRRPVRIRLGSPDTGALSAVMGVFPR